VIDIKPRDAASDFVVIDAGMTELMRPALYDAFHRIEPVRPRGGAAERQYEVVGPVCESSDVVGRDRRLPRLEVGDLVAIRDAGGNAARSVEAGRPEGAPRVVSRLRHVDRRGDRARAAG